MSNENNSLDKTFEIACKSIEVLGDAGVANAVSGAVGAVGGMASSVVDSAGRTASSIVEMFDHILQNRQAIKLQKLQEQKQQMENVHQEKMQKIQNEHEERMKEKQFRHEETMHKQQCEILKVAIETASAAYEKKIDFYTAQLNCLENMYSKERDLLSEHIKFLEDERRQYISDANKYALISSDISKLEEQKTELFATYLKSQGNLEDAIKYLEIDKSFNSNLNDMKKGLIGNG
jgi:hypothetical protein